ncbi:protein phosphatase 2b catalytic calcineurin family phosphatse superfamily protein [Cystoisospora suis]|uniref:Protein phosphatase 2b catalytic calcineurin family phosphatse superfamily protein n=1 Tax=Cystoisospora suis TaxID=483139 RepID=A0A2C6KKJ8_9APIC|nr:protein phosphatase 2b catalytic calcineurin family phosphatse superfamily protein [Cystoisospora suis]
MSHSSSSFFIYKEVCLSSRFSKDNNNTLNIQQFNFSPHPYHLPNFMDVFTWSIPFVSEKVTEMLYGILNPSVDDEEEDEDLDDVELPPEVVAFMNTHLPSAVEDPSSSSTPAAQRRSSAGGDGRLSKERADALRKKVQSVGRLMRVFKTIRQENELIVRLKGCTPGHRIPVGLLLQGREGIVNGRIKP